MPEGHVIHRFAAHHRDLLAGVVVRATSPQGRFSAGARRIDRRKLLDVEAHGKHLFYRFERTESLHVHLGLYGRFREFDENPPPPTPATRLTLIGGSHTVYLAGPSVCELVEPAREQAILSRLGPDPLQNGSEDNTGEVFASNLARRRIPIGAALLDQRVIAGIGNIFRSESLFLTGISPYTESRMLARNAVEMLWETCVRVLGNGLEEGRIVTVPGANISSERRRDGSGFYVYQRHGRRCRQCGEPISRQEMANRMLWWCPGCQPDSREIPSTRLTR